MTNPRPSLLAELKRRHVLRVAGIYMVGFWLILQVVDVVTPALALPDWTMRVLLLAGIVGLPIAFVLAWVYDFSRHGIVRTPPVTGDVAKEKRPKSARAFELYLRANQISVQAGQWARARDMYLEALEHDPEFAPAWARLGRCHRLIGKFTLEPGAAQAELANAEAAFERALALDPELSITHLMYAALEIDLGRAEDAMVRLLARAQVAGADADILSGLVQACRFCGLLDASIAAYERARQIDPHVRTSVAHSYFMLGRYEDAIAEFNNADIGLLGGLALAMLGRTNEAIALLAAREKAQTDNLVGTFIGSLRATLEGRTEDARALVADALSPRGAGRDGEAIYYMARQTVKIGDLDWGSQLLEQAVDAGFFCAPAFARDPWLDPLRGRAEFAALLLRVDTRHRQAVAAFNQTGGGELLGGLRPATAL